MAKTRDEAFQQYEETLAKISKEAQEASEKARATLHTQLATIRAMLHEELKGVRAISQKTKRSKKNAG